MAEIINTGDLSPDTPLGENEALWIYNGLDVCVTDEVFANLRQLVDPVAMQTYEFSKALQAPVLEMTMRGLLVNQPRKHKVLMEMREKLARLQEQFDTIVSEGIGIPPINWRSPVQLNNLLYDVMGLPEQKKRNANGVYARYSGREALETLTQYYIAEPILNHLLAMRDLGKSIGFLETGIDPDGRMRTNLNIAGTNTGRLASSISDFGTGTNLQNVTAALRSVFVADPGMKFANLDLEQADSRNVGALCWNEFVDSHGESWAGKYLDLCESGDLHTAVCKMASPDLGWGKLLNEDGTPMTDRQIADQKAYRHKSYRDNAKVLGHGSNYLGTPPTMAKHSKLPRKLVEQFQSNYFSALPCIPEWHKSIFTALEQGACLTTPFGRRRFFFGRPKEAATRREAVAYQPQSMTSDEINNGIIKLWRANRVQLLIQVHDSILFQYPEEEEAEILPWALETLKTYLTLKRGREFVVPTEAMVGWNWGYYDEKDNVDGLKKWKGKPDDRTRQEKNFKLSVRGF